jgi:hypothetical protein
MGEAIGCVTPADFLIAAGVSHWGAYAFLAALALRRADWNAHITRILDPALDQSVIEAMVRHGPAVDGVSGRQEATLDAIPMPEHHALLNTIRALLDNASVSTDFDRRPRAIEN